MNHVITEIHRVSDSDVTWKCACGGSGRCPEARAALAMSAHLGTANSGPRGDSAPGTADSGPRGDSALRGDGLLVQDLALCLYALGALSERSSIRLGDRYLAALRRIRSHLGYTGKTLPGEIADRLETALPPPDSGPRGDYVFTNMLASDVGRLLAVVNGNAMRERRLRSRAAEDALMKARRDLCVVLGVQRKDESAELIRDRVLAGLHGAAVVTDEDDLRQSARSGHELDTG